MSWSINNLTAPDNYTPASTLDGLPHLRRATLDVQNAAIYFEVKTAGAQPGAGMSEGAATWGPEEFAIPGSKPLSRRGIVGIRFRAAVAAAQLPTGKAQAQVTLTALD